MTMLCVIHQIISMVTGNVRILFTVVRSENLIRQSYTFSAGVDLNARFIMSKVQNDRIMPICM